MPIDLTYLKPPEEDSINVVSLAAATPSAAIPMWATNGLCATISFISDTDVFITISKDFSGTVTDPNPTATTGGGRCWLIPARVPTTFKLGNRNRYFKAYASDACYLRWRTED